MLVIYLFFFTCSSSVCLVCMCLCVKWQIRGRQAAVAQKCNITILVVSEPQWQWANDFLVGTKTISSFSFFFVKIDNLSIFLEMNAVSRLLCIRFSFRKLVFCLQWFILKEKAISLLASVCILKAIILKIGWKLNIPSWCVKKRFPYFNFNLVKPSNYSKRQ